MGADFITAAVALGIYKVAALLVGLSLAYMGYRLFLAGFTEASGDMQVSWGDRCLTLRRGSPGIFFVVLGTTIIVTNIARGLDLSTMSGDVRSVGPSDAAAVISRLVEIEAELGRLNEALATIQLEPLPGPMPRPTPTTEPSQ